MGEILVFGHSNGKVAIVGTDLANGSLLSSHSFGPVVSNSDSISMPGRGNLGNKAFLSKGKSSRELERQSVITFAETKRIKQHVDSQPTSHINLFSNNQDHSAKKEYVITAPEQFALPELAMEGNEIRYAMLHKGRVTSVIYWAEESRIISAGEEGSLVISDENGVIVKNLPSFKNPIMSIVLVKRNDRFFKNAATKKTNKECSTLRPLQGFQKVLNEEANKQNEVVYISERKSGKTSKRSQRTGRANLVGLLGMWSLLDGKGPHDGHENRHGLLDDEKSIPRNTYQSEIDELKKINSKLLKICSTIESKHE
jgi:hypothetical protein